MQVSAIKNNFELDIKDVESVSDELFFSWLNRIEAELYPLALESNPSEYIKDHSISITAGIDEYDLPSDFKRINLIGGGVFILDDESEPFSTLPVVNYDSNIEGYYLQDDKIYFKPIPSGDYEVKLRYFAKKNEISSVSDNLTLSDEWEGVIIEGLKKMYYAWNEDSVNEQIADQRYARARSETLNAVVRLNDINAITDDSLYFA